MATREPELKEQPAPEWKSPLRKLTQFFLGSRDRWKAKYRALKDECKLLGNQVRAVEKSREKWRQDAQQAQQQLRQVQHALEAYKKSVAAPRPVPGVSWEADELEGHLGWLRGYQTLLASWSHMLAVTATSLKYIRQPGYQDQARAELAAELTPFTAGEETPASRVAERLLAFVKQQSAGLPPGQRLLGSSEVLESLIGKAKQLEGQQSKSGFTKMILGLAASVSEITETTVNAALSAVTVKQVAAWIRSHLGLSVQGQRQHAFARVSPRNKIRINTPHNNRALLRRPGWHYFDFPHEVRRAVESYTADGLSRVNPK